MKYAVLIGRILYSFIFIMAAPGHFSQQEISFAAAAHVPFASIAVPFSGILALVGGLSIALGYKAKWGSWILVVFLIPVTFMMHNFWVVPDKMMAQMQMAMFIKNIALLGSALLISYFGAGPLSLDSRAGNYSPAFENK
ncbi:MAG: DoxX family protein [Ignavibacteriaceae bacterium]|nr:DoxX family protein [Ignavibacteriaceae bacterium]